MSVLTSPRVRVKQLVNPAPEPFTHLDAQAFFEHKLAFETDPSDVHHDLTHGVADFVVLDARQKEAFEARRIPGAQHLPHGRIRPETTRHLNPGQLLITYCWGPGCNGSTKAAAKLSALGFQVKELLGGIEYWQREGYAVEGTDVADDETPHIDPAVGL